MCIFCDILAGSSLASFVYRDERVAAFMDTQPVTPGHTLIIPARHAASLAELDPADGARLFQLGQHVAAALRSSGLPCEGVNFWLADGSAAGQEVSHVHLHVFPRFAGDGFGLRLPPGYWDKPPRSELDEIAGRVRGVMNDE